MHRSNEACPSSERNNALITAKESHERSIEDAIKNGVRKTLLLALLFAMNEGQQCKAQGQKPHVAATAAERSDPASAMPKYTLPEAEQIIRELEQLKNELDNDEWSVREAAQSSIAEKYRKIMETMNPPHEEMQEIFENLEEKRQRKTISPEQYHRLLAAQEVFYVDSYEAPNCIPPGTYEGEVCLEWVRKQTGFTVHLDDFCKSSLQYSSITIDENQNYSLPVLARLATLANGTLAMEDDWRTIRIVPVSDEYKPTVIASEKTLAILTKRDKSEDLYNIDIRTAPNTGTIVNMTDASGPRKGSVWGGKSIISSVSRAITFKKDQPLKVEVTMANRRFLKRIVIDDFKEYQITFQLFECKKFQEDGVWNIPMLIEIANFPKSPGERYNERQNLKAVIEANEYIVRDEEGNILASTPTEGKAEKNLVSLNIQCKGEPYTVDVLAYQAYIEDEIITIDIPAIQEETNR